MVKEYDPKNFVGFRDVKGKVAIVTGAARGIGRNCAEAFAHEGIDVVIADLRPLVHDTWKEISAEYPENKGWSVELPVSGRVYGVKEEPADGSFKEGGGLPGRIEGEHQK